MNLTPDRAFQIKTTELALQRGLQVWIVTGLIFMLLPGTFLGAWNLISIAGRHDPGLVDAGWLQAHGHAQIFGWIGSFILGIGFYSLTKMAHVPAFAVSRMWLSWMLWSAGVALRWATNLWHWQWRWMLPLSATLELAAFVLFFATVRRHRAGREGATPAGWESKAWMVVVIAGSIVFLLALVSNVAATVWAALIGAGPAIAPEWNQRLLVLCTWGFPVLNVWGFSARWLPTFLGLRDPNPRLLLTALAVQLVGLMTASAGWRDLTAGLLLAAACLAVLGLGVFERSVQPPKTAKIHSHFPLFVRLAYAWLLLAASLGLAASLWDKDRGLWGASRHALTVGFLSTMVFAIGQRVLPAFCGMRVLYSPTVMGWSLWLLAVGCGMRVSAEIGAYESYLPQLWPLLPASALIEMTAFTLFAANLIFTLRQPPAHLMARQRSETVTTLT